MVAVTAQKLDIRIHDLIDLGKCYDFLRKTRWPKGVCCTKCTSNRIKKNGHKDSDPYCQKYKCNNCGCRFNDLTGTVLAKKHHAISVWMVMLYLMGLNISNHQIAAELDLNPDVAQDMTTTLRKEISARKPGCKLKGIVECDEVYIKAGHKGHPWAVRRKNRVGRRRGLQSLNVFTTLIKLMLFCQSGKLALEAIFSKSRREMVRRALFIKICSRSSLGSCFFTTSTVFFLSKAYSSSHLVNSSPEIPR